LSSRRVRHITRANVGNAENLIYLNAEAHSGVILPDDVSYFPLGNSA
jgi:hypothetical protein